MPWGGRVISSSTVPAGLLEDPNGAEVLDEFEHLAVAREYSAVKRRIPAARARSASNPRSAVPRPRPCRSSATVTATSAASGSFARRTKRATPTSAPSVRDGDERLVVVVVDIGQIAQHRCGEPLHRREEAPVARLLR